ncbi:MFS transporter [Chengkuizengella axinellae]|uniref:MFS transporter n=1 Tax=Chengkuizengella axinellae TaxID=3064388 RepID=A0ABT9J297_9BACL|nr:MFS transporter [Chengkuizengella sp. 2205SS18-9]MDP5275734.1 MFS transporter [Chengkuizengella sp. 2205SS18-9]
MKSLSRNSKLLLYGQALSYMGDYCVLPALLILSTYYQDYWVVSGVIIVRSIPFIIQPFLGVFVDKFNRVNIMFWTDLIRGGIFLGIILLPQGEYPILFLVLLLFSYGSGVFFNPARLSVMSLLGDDIKKINTIFAKATTLFVIIGALIGGAFLVLGTVKAAVAFNALTYFVSASFIRLIKLHKQKVVKAQGEKMYLSLMVGFKEILHNSFVLNAVFTLMTMAFLWGIVYSYFPIVSQYFGKGEVGNFLLTMGMGIGGLIGAYLVNKWGFHSHKGLLYFVFLSLISLAVYMFSIEFMITFVSAVFFFISMEYGEVISKIKIQENAANEIQGRVFAICESIIGICMSIGSTMINFMNPLLILILMIVMMLGLAIHTITVNHLYLKKSKSLDVTT